MRREHSYRRKRVSPLTFKQHERQKVLLILSGGSVVLGYLFYLIATK